ncbi:hypothetical protein Tco_0408102 [Tanacetum coccineum]
MLKYSFRHDEEYVAIKEDEYDGLTNTSKGAIHTYQEIVRMIDEGWMDLAESKEINEVGEVSIIWNVMAFVGSNRANSDKYKTNPLDILDRVRMNNTLADPMTIIRSILNDSKDKDLRFKKAELE